MGAYDISSKCYSSRKDALQEIEKRLNKRRKLEAKYNREVTVTALSVTESRGYFSAYAQYNVTKESHVVGMRGVDDETVFGESKDTYVVHCIKDIDVYAYIFMYLLEEIREQISQR